MAHDITVEIYPTVNGEPIDSFYDMLTDYFPRVPGDPTDKADDMINSLEAYIARYLKAKYSGVKVVHPQYEVEDPETVIGITSKKLYKDMKIPPVQFTIDGDEIIVNFKVIVSVNRSKLRKNMRRTTRIRKSYRARSTRRNSRR